MCAGVRVTAISVLGAGAFGTALAVTLSASGVPVTLWSRDADQAREMSQSRCNSRRLPNVRLPDTLVATHDLTAACRSDVILLAVPMQTLRGFVSENASLLGERILVSCCKGIDVDTELGPIETLARHVPSARLAILSGPSFAEDIAAGLPTALTLAADDDALAERLQTLLSTQTVRLYRSTDLVGVELGGALKNVIAIACGACIGAGFGESARSALMTRGFAEMQRLAALQGAAPETLVGLSGLGDLALTCTSAQSRNYRFGLSLGRGESFDPSVTVEGAATAAALAKLAAHTGLDLPISQTVAQLSMGEVSVGDALRALLSRPLKKE